MVVKRPSRKTLAFGLVVTALSAAGFVYGTLGEGVSTAARMLGIGVGALGLFIGLAAVAPRLVRPLAHVVGLPAARLGGAAGRLARENAIRNPGRTASTAAALMIGLTLVSFVAVFGKALLASDESALRDQLGTSHVITSQSGWDTVPLGAGEAAASAPGVSSPPRSAATGRSSSAAARSTSAASTRRRSAGRTTSSGSRARPPRSRRSPRGGAIVREGPSCRTAGDSPSDRLSRRPARTSSDRARRLREARRPRPAARQRRPLAGDVRRQLPAAGRPADARAGGLDDRARAGAGGLPGREAPDRRRVHRQLDGVAERRDEPLLRPARPLRDRVPLRDGEHARARRLRADAGARDAARGRDDAHGRPAG